VNNAAGNAENAGLEVRKLVVFRGSKQVVHGINLRIRPASITALLGANGAGKTSTVMALAGILTPSGGEILLNNHSLKSMGADAIRRIGLATVPEGHQVLRELTVLDNLRAAGGHLSDVELAIRVKTQLESFPELLEQLNAHAGDLSGGQQQMVALAQAMIVAPKYLLIDELSFGLAPTVVTRLVPIIRRIAASGVGILLIEQFTTLALALADHAYVMSRGKVSYNGPPAALQSHPEILHQSYFPAELATPA
jgi:branched-chain amino acid transport system ATP-binding protein